MLKHRQYKYFYIFSSATLNETFMAKYYGVLPRTPKVRPKSEIYTPKRDGEHPHPFHMLSPLPPPRGLNSDTGRSKGKNVYPSDQHKDTNNYDATIYQSSRSNEKNAFRKYKYKIFLFQLLEYTRASVHIWTLCSCILGNHIPGVWEEERPSRLC